MSIEHQNVNLDHHAQNSKSALLSVCVLVSAESKVSYVMLRRNASEETGVMENVQGLFAICGVAEMKNT